MPNFIVISGRKQSGKTTSANYLKFLLENLGWEVHITSFATPIKEFCKDILGLTHEQVYGTEEQKNTPTHIKWDTMPDEIKKRYGEFKDSSSFAFEEKVALPLMPYHHYSASGGYIIAPTGPMTAREVMQIFGTDIFRNFFDYEIWAKAPFKKFKDSEFDFVIIDDCRFPNEAEASKAQDAVLIRLTRDVLGADQHISEKAMDDYPDNEYDMIIENQGLALDTLYLILRNFTKRYE
jgi:hypothetical protein